MGSMCNVTGHIMGFNMIPKNNYRWGAQRDLTLFFKKQRDHSPFVDHVRMEVIVVCDIYLKIY